MIVSGAGNGWGKSELIAAIFAAVMWPELAPPALAHPIFTDWNHPKQGRIYSTPAELAEIGSLQRAISRIFPKDRYVSSKGRYDYPSVFRTDTGWILDLFSYERSAKEAAGPNIGLQAFNEPPPEDIFKEATARARAGGFLIGGMTSLDDEPWIVGGLFDKADGKEIRVRFGNSCENCKQHGKNGNLDHDAIMRSLAQHPDDEREARFSGKPLSLSSRIFRNFDRAVHVIPETGPGSDHSVFMAVDPAGGKPFACVWAFADTAGNVTIFDEWPQFTFFGSKDPGLNVTDYCEIFRTKEANLTVAGRVLDRHYGNTRHKPGSATLREDFWERGFEFIDSYSVGEDRPEVQTGILKVLDYLRYDKSKPIDSANHPQLHITNNCRNTIESLSKWTRDPKTLKPRDDHFKDFSDAVRYLLMSGPKHEVASTWVPSANSHYGVNNG